MEVATIQVEKRQAAGTNATRRLRGTGKIPMVLYGGGQEPVSLQGSYDEIRRYLGRHLRVYRLQMDGLEQPGYLKDVQWDCLTDEPLHIDFQRIEMDQPLVLEIELVLLGRPVGLTTGGRLVQDKKTISLACLPAHVPEQLEIAIADLDCGQKIRAKDLQLPEGCKLDVPEEQVLVHVTEA